MPRDKHDSIFDDPSAEYYDQRAAAKELLDACRAALGMVDALLEEKRMLAAKIAGTTTIGNHRAMIRAAITKAEGRKKIVCPEHANNYDESEPIEVIDDGGMCEVCQRNAERKAEGNR